MRAKHLVMPLVLILAVALLVPVALAAPPARFLDGFCGAPWGADQAATKKAIAAGPFKAVLASEDAEILVFRGEFFGYPADFSFCFVAGKLAGGVILIPDPDGTAFNNLYAAHANKLGPPDIIKHSSSAPAPFWFFRSPFKPPPNFAYISIMKTTGAFIDSDKHKDRPAVAISCFDDQLEQQYRQARAAKNK
jgi:hypothetical protein